MKLSEAQQRIETILKYHGDLEMFDDDLFAIDGIYPKVSDGSFPELWKMPKGFKYVQVTSKK